MTSFQGNSWEVTLPPDWIGEHSEECSTIYHPDGVGALQISSYSKNEPVTETDLKSLAQEHIESGANLGEAEAGAFRGFTFALGVDGEFWQFWYVSKDNAALLITYNCSETDLGPERDHAKSIVASLKAT
jgi:hypothetical protein